MACPECSNDSAIDVAAVVWVRVMNTREGVQTDSDESFDGSHEWDSDSCAVCSCGFSGKVRDFEGAQQ